MFIYCIYIPERSSYIWDKLNWNPIHLTLDAAIVCNNPPASNILPWQRKRATKGIQIEVTGCSHGRKVTISHNERPICERSWTRDRVKALRLKGWGCQGMSGFHSRPAPLEVPLGLGRHCKATAINVGTEIPAICRVCQPQCFNKLL